MHAYSVHQMYSCMNSCLKRVINNDNLGITACLEASAWCMAPGARIGQLPSSNASFDTLSFLLWTLGNINQACPGFTIILLSFDV